MPSDCRGLHTVPEVAIARRTVLLSATLSALGGCGGTRAAGTVGDAATSRAATPGENDSVRSPSPAPSSAAPAVVAAEITHGPRDKLAVALTFHGAGPLPIARAVLDELRRGGVQVTVLAVGSWLDSEPAGARLVLDDGHELGNHTAHHLPMRALPADSVLSEITGCARSLRRLTGSPGNWFRASGTQHTTSVIRTAAASAGYPVCLSYDVDSLDWRDISPKGITGTVMAAIQPGSIVSMHLGHTGTVAAIGPLLDALAARNLHPVTVSKLLR